MLFPLKAKKGGFVGGGLVDILSYVAFFVIVLVFFIVFTVENSDQKIEGTVQGRVTEMSNQLILQNSLKTEISDGSMSLAELIRVWYNDQENYKDVLKQELVDVAKRSTYKDRTDFDVSIFSSADYSKNNRLIFGSSKSGNLHICYNGYMNCKSIAEVLFPVDDENIIYVVMWK